MRSGNGYFICKIKSGGVLMRKVIMCIVGVAGIVSIVVTGMALSAIEH